MSLFDYIFRPGKAREADRAREEARTFFETFTAYRPAFTNWGGMIYESELVRSAIDARARHISKLKIETVGTANQGLQTKLRLGPNQWQTWSQFLYRVSTILDIHNTGFIVPVLDERLNTTGIFPVLPNRCTIVEYKGTPWVRYEFSNGQVGAVELRRCAILNKHQYRNDFFGENNMALDETMKLINIQNQGIEEGIKSAASFQFMATLSNFAKPEDLALERSRFVRENLSTESRAGRFLLFPNQYKDVKQIDAKPFTIDAEQMKQIRANVFEYFGVNEDVLQNKAFGDAWSAFYEGAIEPFAIQFSETVTKALFSERERAQGTYIIATSNRLQYMTNKDKLEVSAQLLDRGVMSINDVRDIWNLPHVENGDERIIRGEYYNADEKVTVQEGGTDDANEI